MTKGRLYNLIQVAENGLAHGDASHTAITYAELLELAYMALAKQEAPE